MLIFLLLLVIVVSWCLGYRYKSSKQSSMKNGSFSRDYFIGLQYLIDEQPDKAVDIFVKMLEVNSDTVETHLALGGLFRRRGEVNRAIRIHQNLIARPQLEKDQRLRALSELAQDYLHAGVLDRAEGLFFELIKSGWDTLASFKSVLEIYEQQKEWMQAINVAKKMELIHSVNMKPTIAHYFCELGDLQRALEVDKNCVRASLMQGESFFKAKDYKSAIKAYNKVKKQNCDYVSETIKPLAKCYENLNNEKEFICYLQSLFVAQVHVVFTLTLAEFLQKYNSSVMAIDFITEQLQGCPSLHVLNCLIELYINNSSVDSKDKFIFLREITDKLLSEKPNYRCSQCGFSSKSLYWRCPACRRWESIKPIYILEGD